MFDLAQLVLPTIQPCSVQLLSQCRFRSSSPPAVGLRSSSKRIHGGEAVKARNVNIDLFDRSVRSSEAGPRASGSYQKPRLVNRIEYVILTVLTDLLYCHYEDALKTLAFAVAILLAESIYTYHDYLRWYSFHENFIEATPSKPLAIPTTGYNMELPPEKRAKLREAFRTDSLKKIKSDLHMSTPDGRPPLSIFK
ncbi:MAG TPA: hypothetical protein VGZ00_03340 [Candidatus Baltobacteraceae bacterium]|nr:hypothetical protein [Candidatus Baltobacteraceae bacterium]